MYATDWGGERACFVLLFFFPPPRLSAAVIGVFLPSTAFSTVLLYRRSLQAALKGSPPSKFLLVILCVVPAGSLHLLLCGEREGSCFFIMLSLHIALCTVCCVFSILCALHSVLSTLQCPVAAPFLAFFFFGTRN